MSLSVRAVRVNTSFAHEEEIGHESWPEVTSYSTLSEASCMVFLGPMLTGRKKAAWQRQHAHIAELPALASVLEGLNEQDWKKQSQRRRKLR